MLRRLAPLLLVLSLGACTAAGRAGNDAGTPTVTPIVRPMPRPEPTPAQLDRERVKEALARRRVENLDRFLAYREGRVYPRNTSNTPGTHIWLDSVGNLCAAATIISGDWGRDATSRVALENNFIALADVRSGPLHDWILTSGLTHHEIVAIQVPAPIGRGEMPDMNGDPEIERLYAMYIDVERQVRSLWPENLEAATDALMERPDLARALLDGVAAGPGHYATPLQPVAIGFAQPPPA